MKDNVFEKLKKDLPDIQKNILLKDYTTFKIGGPAKYFFIAKTKEDLASVIESAKKLKLKIFILGGGSNLLVSDKGFRGLVVKPEFSSFNFQKNKAYVEAGMGLTKFSYLTAKKSLSGMEWSAGIPGTVGGAIYGNAQAFGFRMSDFVESVEAMDTDALKFKKISKKQCQFSLKNSIFKKDKNLIIISTVLKLKKGNQKEIQKKIDEYINHRKKNHPLNFPSAGSVFVNPENNGEVIRSSSLIEKCGLKGKKVGGAQISEKHANFIINLGGAKAKDVLALIKLAKQKVKKTFGIDLETEVQLVGF